LAPLGFHGFRAAALNIDLESSTSSAEDSSSVDEEVDSDDEDDHMPWELNGLCDEGDDVDGEDEDENMPLICWSSD